MADTMDPSALAELMLKWERVRRMADEYEQAIKDAVLQMGKSQTVGNVVARHSKGRRSFDYETPGQAAPPDVIKAHTETIVRTDWGAVCKAAEIEPVVTGESGPSVSLKLVAP